jgi:hypothetical protein
MTNFKFPANLKKARSSFRIRLLIRYLNDEGSIVDAKEVMPGAGEKDYWECETDEQDSENYCRSENAPEIDVYLVPASRRRLSLITLRPNN